MCSSITLPVLLPEPPVEQQLTTPFLLLVTTPTQSATTIGSCRTHGEQAGARMATFTSEWLPAQAFAASTQEFTIPLCASLFEQTKAPNH